MMKKYFILIFIAWIFCFVAMQAKAALTARLDRNQISANETVQLIIEADNQVAAMPDTTLLTRDFDVMGVASGSRLNIINGRIDARTTWTISLAPKRSGELIIPSLELNGEQTRILKLQVSETSASSGPDAATPVFIETEVDQRDPYVQGMVRYTTRIFFAVPLTQGNLSEPQPEDAFIHRFGEDREYSVVRDGETYHVIERQYVIFPQTSGSMVLPAPVLTAQIPQNVSRRDPFFDRILGNNRPIQLRGEVLTLNVRPRPDQSKSEFWLPAESVELLEDWETDEDSIAVGEPLTRNITIKALGVAGEQLPDLRFADVEGFKLYPDRTQSKTQHLQHNIVGEKTQHIAYMPMQSGKYTLPAITLHWWDTKTDKEQVATLPARTVAVIPAADQQHVSMQPSDPAKTKPHATTVEKPETTTNDNNFYLDESKTDEMIAPPVNFSGWFWASLFFALLWLMTLGLWWQRRHISTQYKTQKSLQNFYHENDPKARERFLLACRANDPHQARHYLLKWATTNWPQTPPKGLEDLALRLNSPVTSEALVALDRALYQKQQKTWKGQELAKLLSKFPNQDQEPNGKTALPKLYA